ncbi:MAG: SulP family inorganic anion transporter [Kofleriaceae bacterium]|nr:SulP family inorganic anion transporter [Kofleriaceae bacterium]
MALSTTPASRRRDPSDPTQLKRSTDRESARAKARFAKLNTNRAHQKDSRKLAAGVGEIRGTLRDRWSEVLSNGLSFHDLLAGLTVATVAIPLNVALALAAGLSASAGLIAGAVGGVVAAAFGGSNYQVSGPAAALNVMVFGVVAKFGPGGAMAAALVCGVMGILLGALGLGKFSKLLPKVVLAGFTTGVGLKLFDQQVPILLGSDLALWHMITEFWEMQWLREVEWLAVVCGMLVAWITVGLAHLKSFPSALLGIIIATFVAYELDWNIAKVGEVDLQDLSFAIPTLTEGTGWAALIVAALPLALLSGAESLISAKAIDDVSGGKSGYAPNAELFGQGVGNVAAGFFGGMPLAGVIVRTTVNQQAGARTRMAAIYHGVFIAVAAYLFGHSLSVIPIAALAGLLVTVAWRLIKIQYFVDALRSNRFHAVAFLVAAIGTLLGNLMTGLVVGTVLVYLDAWLEKRKHSRKAKDAPILRPSPTIRAVVSQQGTPESPESVPLNEQAVWSRHVRTRPKIHPTAYVHPTASVIGWVEIGREVNVAADTSVRADEGAPFYIGDRSNVQDGVVLHALKDKWVMVGGRRWAIWIGPDCSLAHQALVHGPSMIGAHTFIGFKAIVHDSIVGEGCFIGHSALVVGVEIPPHKRVPSGWVVDSPAKVAELPDVEHAHAHFNEDVVQVNRGLVVAYARQAEQEELPPPGAEPRRMSNPYSIKPL